MNPSPTRDLTPVVPKRLRSDYTIAMLSYFLLGLCLAGFYSSNHLNSTSLCFAVLGNIAAGLFCFSPLLKSIQREFSHRCLNIMALGCVFMISLSLLLTGYVEIPYALLSSVTSLVFAILLDTNRATIANLGPASTVARRLNLAQAFLPLGSIIGVILVVVSPIALFLLTAMASLMLLIKQVRTPAPQLQEWNEGSPDADRAAWQRALAITWQMLAILAIICLVTLFDQGDVAEELSLIIIFASILFLPVIANLLMSHTRQCTIKLLSFKKNWLSLIIGLLVNTAAVMAFSLYNKSPLADWVDLCLILLAVFLGYSFGAKRFYQEAFSGKSIITACVGLILLAASTQLPETELWSNASLNYALVLPLIPLVLGAFLLTGFNNALLRFGWQGMDSVTRNAANNIGNIVLGLSIASGLALAMI